MRNTQTRLNNIISMIKELDDYLDILENKYPHISRYELKRVLEHGFHTFYTLNKKGADLQIHNKDYTAYCGKMFIDNHKILSDIYIYHLHTLLHTFLTFFTLCIVLASLKS